MLISSVSDRSNASASIFRANAIAHVSSQHFGTVLLAQPLSLRWLTTIFAVMACVIIAFFFLFETSRKAECSGSLLPAAGVIRILPLQAGVVKEVKIREGQFVHAGDILFSVSGERGNIESGSAEGKVTRLLMARRDSFNVEIHKLGLQRRFRIEANESRIRDLGTELARIGEQIMLQKQRVMLAEQNMNRYAELQTNNYISLAQLQDRQGELLDQRQRLADLDRSQASVQTEMKKTKADLADLRLQGEREADSLMRDISAVDQDITENETRRELYVRAPESGTVSAVTVVSGQTVIAGTTLATVLPAGSQLMAEILAPSRSVGFIQPGMHVLLRYQAYPYQKFGQHGAVVTEVANTALRPEELGLNSNSTNGEPLYRIRLRLDHQTVKAYGHDMPLIAGMAVDASILLEHRRLYQWVLEPLFSISGRL